MALVDRGCHNNLYSVELPSTLDNTILQEVVESGPFNCGEKIIRFCQEEKQKAKAPKRQHSSESIATALSRLAEVQHDDCPNEYGADTSPTPLRTPAKSRSRLRSGLVAAYFRASGLRDLSHDQRSARMLGRD